MKIGVISDTHISGGRRVLPPRIFTDFDGVDLILHAGDLMIARVVTELEALAPVIAVRGNNDGPNLNLRDALQMEIESCTIGLTHGDRYPHDLPRPPRNLDFAGNKQTAAFALSHFPTADVVIFGHSHRPMCAWHCRDDGSEVLLLNPGSPTDKRWAANYGVAILEIENGKPEAELILW